ncbi:hypothetical protein [Rhizobium tumorigenes]|uniref:Uncharacterized protein n=1 Tax=Rhizobium tumorigenes TaxID=2041385 RepID=A0AAF1K8Q1_9HYPH|nr:hypothetical protein [Rhizobium tumorigenes]WFR97835.1 hypothetical protein PR017_18150 [Rhizobium tumorigenes]
MDRDVGPELRPLDTLSADERQRVLSQLHRVIVGLIDELASIGRIDLIGPLHDLAKLLRAISADIAHSEAFREVVASVAQLVGRLET